MNPFLNIDEDGIADKMQVPKNLLTCPICYNLAIDGVQCLSCQRLFCEADFYKSGVQACPLCKASPWRGTNSLHIMYRTAFQELKFHCKECSIQNLTKIEFQKHNQEKHKQIYQYALIRSHGFQKLTFYQNLQIAYKNKEKIYLMDNKQQYIKIYLRRFQFQTTKKKGEIISEKSNKIVQNEEYIVWVFKGHYDDEQFYAEKYQKEIEESYQLYLHGQSDQFYQIQIKTLHGTIIYQLNFDQMLQTNTQTDFSRAIKRMIIAL